MTHVEMITFNNNKITGAFFQSVTSATASASFQLTTGDEGSIESHSY